MSPVAAARRRLALELRGRVAGRDAEARAERIWRTPGPRWFTPDDPIWRVHADAAMFPGGIRALLLQSLHPLAMAGVAAHSGYRGDPWGRLQRTSEYLAVTTFGTVEHAEETIDRVRRIHRRVRGVTDDGRAYAASDPHLLRWVHVAEIDSFLATFQAYASPRLTPTEADTYVAQTGEVAARLGVVDPPQDTGELRAALRDYRPELEPTGPSRDAARFLLLDPPLPWAARPGYGLLAAGAVATLPRWSRRMLALPPAVPALDAPGRIAGGLGTAAVRWAMADPAVAHRRRLEVHPSAP